MQLQHFEFWQTAKEDTQEKSNTNVTLKNKYHCNAAVYILVFLGFFSFLQKTKSIHFLQKINSSLHFSLLSYKIYK